MYCPKCSQHLSDDAQFCSRCGLLLGDVPNMIVSGDRQIRRERHEMQGFGFVLATVLMLLNFLFVFGLITLPHMTNTVFLWLWILFLASSLVTAGLGFFNLSRGGFFKGLKERDLRRQLAEREQERRTLEEQRTGATPFDTKFLPHRGEPLSVADATTRELQAVPHSRGSSEQKS